MKKVFILFLSLAMLFSMTACDQSENSSDLDENPAAPSAETTEKEIIDGNIIEYCPQAKEFIGEEDYLTHKDSITQDRVVHLPGGLKYQTKQADGTNKIQREYQIALTLHPKKDIIIAERITGDYIHNLDYVSYQLKSFLDRLPFSLSYQKLQKRIEAERKEIIKNGQECYECSFTLHGITYSYFENEDTDEIYVEAAIDPAHNLEPSATEQVTDYKPYLKLKNYKVKSFYKMSGLVTVVSVCNKCKTEYNEYTFRLEDYSINKPITSGDSCEKCSGFEYYYFPQHLEILKYIDY